MVNAEATKLNVKTILDKITLVKPKQSNNNDDNSIYELLIIAPRRYAGLLQPLVRHKKNMDVPTRLVTLDEVYRHMYWQGRDKAEKIKYYIKNAYDYWGIKYVLLVGGFRQLPIRYVYNDEPWGGYPEPRFISDLYYADIYDSEGNFSSWDTNNNGIYGEWKGEEAQDKDIDLYPDVYVGRLACRNRLEVRVMVNKIIRYERNTYGSEWFNRFAVMAGDTYTGKPTYEGEENTQKAIDNMSGFTPIKLWTSDGTLTGPRDIMRVFNNGCGFVFMDGHASPMVWFTHLPNGTNIDPLRFIHIMLLSNRHMLPICVAGSCHNCQFDVSITRIFDEQSRSRFEYAPECWGWWITRKIGGGTIATIGNTGLGYTKEDKNSKEGAGDYLDPRFFWHVGNNSVDILGEAWGNTISDYIDKYPIDWNTPAGNGNDSSIDARVVQMWVLFGDPSLKIGGYPPDTSKQYEEFCRD